MLLVRDTMRLIGEIPAQAGRALQKKLALTIFRGGGGWVWDGDLLGLFYDFLFLHNARHIQWEYKCLPPDTGHAGLKDSRIRYFSVLINQMTRVVYMFIAPPALVTQGMSGSPPFPPLTGRSPYWVSAQMVSPHEKRQQIWQTGHW